MSAWCAAVFLRVRTAFDGRRLTHRGVFTSTFLEIDEIMKIQSVFGAGTMPLKIELRRGGKVRLHTFDNMSTTKVETFAAVVQAYADRASPAASSYR